MKKELNGRNVFLIAFAMALICFLPFLIRDRGFFIYFGDYDSQQIPFYIKVHEAVRSGKFFWDMKTDLGSSIYTSYSFYLLGSPFFWLTIPFPKQALPYLMPFLQMLKIALASLGGYYYSRQFTKDDRSACLGGLLYGFCGFMMVSLVFNHFGEVVAFFPFYLLAADDLAQKKKYGVFALLTALMAVTNYFFFIGEAVFLVIYVLVRYVADKQYDTKDKLSCLARFAVEGLSGILISAFLLLPSLIAVAGNKRVSETIFDRNLFVYGDIRTYLALIKSLVLQPDVINGETLFGTTEGTVASLSLYLPLFAFCGVAAYFMQKKGWDFLKKMCMICLFLALIPLGNSLFVAGNGTYYARWFFMPLLLMAVMTAIAVEEFERKAFTKGTLLYGGLLVVFLLIGMITKSAFVNAEGVFLIKNRSDYEMEVAAGISCFFILAYLVWILKKDKKKQYLNIFLGAGILCCMGTFYLHMYMGAIQVSDEGRSVYKEQLLTDMSMVRPQAGEFYRIETDHTSTNEMLTQDMPSVSCFLSTVSGSIMDFYGFAGIDRSVASELPYERLGIRNLLSVRYFLQNEKNSDDYAFVDQGLLAGYQEAGEENGYSIYENENYLHMGTVFNNYMKRSEYEKLSDEEQDQVLLFALVMEDDKTAEFQKTKGITELFAEEFQQQIQKVAFDDTVKQQCMELNQTAADRFEEGDTKLTFTYTKAKGGLAFLSVPYSSGFTAYVDGKETAIIKTDGGLMAVPIEEGTQELILIYKEPGFTAGIICSILGICLFAVWIFTHKRGMIKL